LLVAEGAQEIITEPEEMEVVFLESLGRVMFQVEAGHNQPVVRLAVADAMHPDPLEPDFKVRAEIMAVPTLMSVVPVVAVGMAAVARELAG
jgi:hypothetical protein